MKVAQSLQSKINDDLTFQKKKAILQENVRRVLEDINEKCKIFRFKDRNHELIGYDDALANLYYDIASLCYKRATGDGSLDNLYCIKHYLKKSIKLYTDQIPLVSPHQERLSSTKLNFQEKINYAARIRGLNIVKKSKNLLSVLNEQIKNIKKEIRDIEAKLESDIKGGLLNTLTKIATLNFKDPKLTSLLRCCRLVDYSLKLGDFERASHYLNIVKQLPADTFSHEMAELEIRLKNVVQMNAIIDLEVQLALPIADDIDNIVIKKPENIEHHNTLLKEWKELQSESIRLLIIYRPHEHNSGWEAQISTPQSRNTLIYQISSQSNFEKFLNKCHGQYKAFNIGGEIIELLFNQEASQSFSRSTLTELTPQHFKSKRQKLSEKCKALSDCYGALGHVPLGMFYEKSYEFYKAQQEKFSFQFYSALRIGSIDNKASKIETLETKGEQELKIVADKELLLVNQFFPIIPLSNAARLNDPISENEFLNKILPMIDQVNGLIGFLTLVEKIDWQCCSTNETVNTLRDRWVLDYQKFKLTNPLIKKYLLIFEQSSKHWYFYGEMQHERIVEGYIEQDKTNRIKSLLPLLPMTSEHITERTRRKLTNDQLIIAKLNDLYPGTSEFVIESKKKELHFLKKVTVNQYKENYKNNTGILIYHFNDRREWRRLRDRILLHNNKFFTCVLKIPKLGCVALLIDRRGISLNGVARIYVMDSTMEKGSSKNTLQRIMNWLNEVEAGQKYESVIIPCSKQSSLSEDSLLHAYLNAQAALFCMEIGEWQFFQENLFWQKFSSVENVEKIKKAYTQSLVEVSGNDIGKLDCETKYQKLLDEFRQAFVALIAYKLSKKDSKNIIVEAEEFNKSVGNIMDYDKFFDFMEKFTTEISSQSTQSENDPPHQIRKILVELKSASEESNDLSIINPTMLVQIMLSGITQAANQLLQYQEQVSKQFESFERSFHDYVLVAILKNKPLDMPIKFSDYARKVKNAKDKFIGDLKYLQNNVENWKEDSFQALFSSYIDFISLVKKELDESGIINSHEIFKQITTLCSTMDKDKNHNPIWLTQLLVVHIQTISKFIDVFAESERGLESFINAFDILLRHNLELLPLPAVHAHLRKITFDVIGNHRLSFDDVKSTMQALCKSATVDIGLKTSFDKANILSSLNAAISAFEMCKTNNDDLAVHHISAYIRTYMAAKQDHYLDQMAAFRHDTLFLFEEFEAELHTQLLHDLKNIISKKPQIISASRSLKVFDDTFASAPSKLYYHSVYKKVVESLKLEKSTLSSRILDGLLNKLNSLNHSHYSYIFTKLDEMRKMLARFAALEPLLPNLGDLFYSFLIEQYDHLPETQVLNPGKGIHKDIYERLNQSTGFSDIQTIVNRSNDPKMTQLMAKCLVFIQDGDKKASAEVSACIRQCLVDTTKKYADSLSLFRNQASTVLNQLEKNIYAIFSSYDYCANEALREKLKSYLNDLTKIEFNDKSYKENISCYLKILFFLQNEKICSDEISKFSALLSNSKHNLKPQIKERCERILNLISSYIHWHQPIQSHESDVQSIYEINIDSAIGLSQAIKKLKEFPKVKWVPGNEIRIISSAPIYIDLDLNVAEYSGISITLITPEFKQTPQHQGLFRIDTSGKNADPWSSTVAQHGGTGGGNQPGGNGANGFDGKDGHNAGHVYLVCNHMPNAEILARGGLGANGQMGGNGGAGGNGKNGATHDYQKHLDKFKEYAGGWYSRSFFGYAMGSDGEPGGMGGNAGNSGHGGEGGFKGKVEVSCFNSEAHGKNGAEIKIESEKGKDGKNGDYAKAGVAGDPGEDGLDCIFWSNSVGFLGSRTHEGVKGRITDPNFIQLRGINCELGKDAREQQEKRVLFGSGVVLPRYDNEQTSQVVLQNKKERLKNRKSQEGRLVRNKHEGYLPHLPFRSINKNHVFKQTKSLFESIIKTAKTGGFQHWRANVLNDFLDKMAAAQQLPYYKVDNLPDIDLQAQQILALQESFEDLHNQINERLESQKINRQELSIGTTALATELLHQHNVFKTEITALHRNLEMEIEAINVNELSLGLELRSSEIVNNRRLLNQNVNIERAHQKQAQQTRTEALVEMTRTEKITLLVDKQNIKIDPKIHQERKNWKQFENNSFSDIKLIQQHNLFHAKSMSENLIRLGEDLVKILKKLGKSNTISISNQELSDFIYVFLYNLPRVKLRTNVELNAIVADLKIYLEQEKAKISTVNSEAIDLIRNFARKLQLESRRQIAYHRLEATLNFCKESFDHNSFSLKGTEEYCRLVKRQLRVNDELLLAKILSDMESSDQVIKIFPERLNSAINSLNPSLLKFFTEFNLDPNINNMINLMKEISSLTLFKSKSDKVYHSLISNQSNLNKIIQLFAIIKHNIDIFQRVSPNQSNLSELVAQQKMIASGILRYPPTSLSKVILSKTSFELINTEVSYQSLSLVQSLQIFQTSSEPKLADEILAKMCTLGNRELLNTPHVQEFFDWMVSHYEQLYKLNTPFYHNLQTLYLKIVSTDENLRFEPLTTAIIYLYGILDAKTTLANLERNSHTLATKEATLILESLAKINDELVSWLSISSNDADLGKQKDKFSRSFALYGLITNLSNQDTYLLEDGYDPLYYGFNEIIKKMITLLEGSRDKLINELFNAIANFKKQSVDQEKSPTLEKGVDNKSIADLIDKVLLILKNQQKSLYQHRLCAALTNIGTNTEIATLQHKNRVATYFTQLIHGEKRSIQQLLPPIFPEDLKLSARFINLRMLINISSCMPSLVAKVLYSDLVLQKWHDTLFLFFNDSTLDQKRKLSDYLEAIFDVLMVCNGISEEKLKSIIIDQVIFSVNTKSIELDTDVVKHRILLNILRSENSAFKDKVDCFTLSQKKENESLILEIDLFKNLLWLNKNTNMLSEMNSVKQGILTLVASLKNTSYEKVRSLKVLTKLYLELESESLSKCDKLNQQQYLFLFAFLLREHKELFFQETTTECLKSLIPFLIDKVKFQNFRSVSLNPNAILTLSNIKVLIKSQSSILKFVEKIEENIRWVQLYQLLRMIFEAYDDVRWIDLAFMDEVLFQTDRDTLFKELAFADLKELETKIITVKKFFYSTFQAAQQEQVLELLSILKGDKIKITKEESELLIQSIMNKLSKFDGFCVDKLNDKQDALQLSYALKFTQLLKLINYRFRNESLIKIQSDEFLNIIDVLNCFENLNVVILAIKEAKITDWLKLSLVEHILEKYNLVFKNENKQLSAELRHKLLQIDVKALFLFNNVFITEYADQIRQAIYHDLSSRLVANHQKISDTKFLGIIDDLRKFDPDQNALTQLAGISLAIWNLNLYELKFNQSFNSKIVGLNNFNKNELEQCLLYLNRIRVNLGIEKRSLFQTFFKSIHHALIASRSNNLLNLISILQSLNRQEISFVSAYRIVQNYPLVSWKDKLRLEIKNEKEFAGTSKDATVDQIFDSIIGDLDILANKHTSSLLSKNKLTDIRNQANQYKNKMSTFNFKKGDEAASIRVMIEDMRNKKEYQDDPEAYVYTNLDSIVPLLLYSWAIANSNGNKLQKPRDTQLTALELFIHSVDHGLLQQIRTGEGKTLTVGLLSAIKALCGYSVDVVSSNRDLAISGESKCRKFYQLLNITSGHNCDSNDDANIQAYRNSIVYGEVAGFQKHILEEEFNGKDVFGNRYKTKSGPRKKCLIVDEVDSMGLDKARHVLYLSHEIESLKWLESVFINIWIATLRAEVKEQDDIEKHVLDISTFIVDRIKSRDIELPSYLLNYVTYKIKRWCDSAFQARFMRENDQFVVDVPKEEGNNIRSKQKDIIALDKDTGIELYSTKWSEGLAQFLQLKYRRRISVESLKAVFISNKNFFQRYGKDLYGLTGTLGSESSRAFLTDVYNVRCINIPTSRPKRYIQCESVVSDDFNSWLDLISDQVILEAQRRPVLIICENVNHAVSIRDELIKNKNVPTNKISSYVRDGDNIEDKFRQTSATLGDIIIATNKGGRGTDIEVSTEANDNGGMHVIVSYLPDNVRIEEQAFGRTSRNGNPGSGQFILCIDPAPYEDVYKLKDLDAKARRKRLLEYSDIIVEREKINRDTREALRLSELKQRNILHLEVEEELFYEFNRLKVNLVENVFHKLFPKEGHPFVHNKVVESFENTLKNRWGFWLDWAKESIEKVENAAQKLSLIDKFKLEFISSIQQECSSNDFQEIVNRFIKYPEDAVSLGIALIIKDKEAEESDKKKYLGFAAHCFSKAISLGDISGFPNIALTYCRILLKSEDGKIVKKQARKELKEALFKLEVVKRNLMSNLEIVRLLPKMAPTEVQQKIAPKENFYQEQISGKLEVIGLQIHHIKNSIGDYAESFDFTSASNPTEADLKTAKEIYNRLVKDNILVGDRLRKIYRRDHQKLKQMLSSQLDPSIAESVFGLLIAQIDFDKTKLEAVVCSGQELWECLGLNHDEESLYILDQERLTRELEARFEDSWKKLKGKSINPSNVDLNLFKNPKEDEKILGEFQEFLVSKKMLVQTKRVSIDKVIQAANQLEHKSKSDNERLTKYQRLVFNENGHETKTLKEFLVELAKSIESHRSISRGGKYFYLKDLPFGNAAEEAAKIYAFLKEQHILKSGGLSVKYKHETGFKGDLKDTLEKVLGNDYKDLQEMIKNKLSPLQGDIRSWSSDIKASLKLFFELEGQQKIPDELNFFKGLGLDKFLVIQEDKSWWDWGAFAVFIIGVVQVIAGAILCVFGIGNIGNALISEGISDMVYAVMSWATGTFSWKEWAAQKAISFSLSLLTAGIQTLATIGKTAAKLGSVSVMSVLSKVLWQAVKEFATTFITNLVTNTVVEEIRKNIIEKVIKGILQKILNEVTNAIREALKKVYRESGAAHLVGILKKFHDSLMKAFKNAQQIFDKFEQLRSQVVSSIENNFGGLISGLKNSGSAIAKVAGTVLDVVKIVNDIWKAVQTATQSIDTVSTFINSIKECIDLLSGKVDRNEATEIGEMEAYKLIDDKVDELNGKVNDFISEKLIKQLDQLLRQVVNGTLGSLCRSIVQTNRDKMDSQLKRSGEKQNISYEDAQAQKISATISQSVANAPKSLSERSERAKKALLSSVQDLKQLSSNISIGVDFAPIMKAGEDIGKGVQQAQNTISNLGREFNIGAIRSSFESINSHFKTLQNNAKDMTAQTRTTIESTSKAIQSQLKQAEDSYKSIEKQFKGLLVENGEQLNAKIKELLVHCQTIQNLKPNLSKENVENTITKTNQLLLNFTKIKELKQFESLFMSTKNLISDQMNGLQTIYLKTLQVQCLPIIKNLEQTLLLKRKALVSFSIKLQKDEIARALTTFDITSQEFVSNYKGQMDKLSCLKLVAVDKFFGKIEESHKSIKGTIESLPNLHKSVLDFEGIYKTLRKKFNDSLSNKLMIQKINKIKTDMDNELLKINNQIAMIKNGLEPEKLEKLDTIQKQIEIAILKIETFLEQQRVAYKSSIDTAEKNIVHIREVLNQAILSNPKVLVELIQSHLSKQLAFKPQFDLGSKLVSANSKGFEDVNKRVENIKNQLKNLNTQLPNIVNESAKKEFMGQIINVEKQLQKFWGTSSESLLSAMEFTRLNLLNFEAQLQGFTIDLLPAERNKIMEAINKLLNVVDTLPNLNVGLVQETNDTIKTVTESLSKDAEKLKSILGALYSELPTASLLSMSKDIKEGVGRLMGLLKTIPQEKSKSIVSKIEVAIKIFNDEFNHERFLVCYSAAKLKMKSLIKDFELQKTAIQKTINLQLEKFTQIQKLDLFSQDLELLESNAVLMTNKVDLAHKNIQASLKLFAEPIDKFSQEIMSKFENFEKVMINLKELANQSGFEEIQKQQILRFDPTKLVMESELLLELFNKNNPNPAHELLNICSQFSKDPALNNTPQFNLLRTTMRSMEVQATNLLKQFNEFEEMTGLNKFPDMIKTLNELYACSSNTFRRLSAIFNQEYLLEFIGKFEAEKATIKAQYLSHFNKITEAIKPVQGTILSVTQKLESAVLEANQLSKMAEISNHRNVFINEFNRLERLGIEFVSNKRIELDVDFSKKINESLHEFESLEGQYKTLFEQFVHDKSQDFIYLNQIINDYQQQLSGLMNNINPDEAERFVNEKVEVLSQQINQFQLQLKTKIDNELAPIHASLNKVKEFSDTVSNGLNSSAVQALGFTLKKRTQGLVDQCLDLEQFKEVQNLAASFGSK